MSFKDILDKHDDHTVVILPRLFKNRLEPVPGLYCEDCGKLIKWLSLELFEELLDDGVELLDMIPEEYNTLQRRIKLLEKNKVKNLKAEDFL